MSVVIRFEHMPQGCEFCRLTYHDFDGETRCCYLRDNVDGLYNERPKACPLIQEGGDPE